MLLSLYCSLTSCIELWSRAPVSCYKILQDEHQRYQLHTAFYSFSCNFQFFPPNAGHCKSFTNRITIPFQILSTYIISKPRSFSFPPHCNTHRFTLLSTPFHALHSPKCNSACLQFLTAQILHLPKYNSACLQFLTAQIHNSALAKMQFSLPAIPHCTDSQFCALPKCNSACLQFLTAQIHNSAHCPRMQVIPLNAV